MNERIVDSVSNVAKSMIVMANTHPCVLAEQIMFDNELYSQRIPTWFMKLQLTLELHADEKLKYHLTVFKPPFGKTDQKKRDIVLAAFFGDDFVERIESGTIEVRNTQMATHYISREVRKYI
jgi:hypothetical protein